VRTGRFFAPNGEIKLMNRDRTGSALQPRRNCLEWAKGPVRNVARAWLAALPYGRGEAAGVPLPGGAESSLAEAAIVQGVG
jgi:hypothetical protein